MTPLMLCGITRSGDLAICVLMDRALFTGEDYLIKICAGGVPVLSRRIPILEGEMGVRELALGIILVAIAPKLNGETTDLSILLFKNNKQVGDPLSFVFPTTN